MTIEGEVVAVSSHWTDDGSRIVTEATVRPPQGDDVVVSQLGGSVDGLAMITLPGPRILTLGMTVAVAAHRAMDLENTEHIALDSLKVLGEPPSFVRTGPTKAGHPLFWESGCVFVTIDSAGTTAIAGDDELPAIQASIDVWNNATQSCSYLDVMVSGRQALEVGRDKPTPINLIKFRDTTWGRPASGKDPARAYDPQAAGLTTVIFVDDGGARDGAIVDADVEINGVNFAISINGASLHQGGIRAELQNTLTHEIGHLHGLEHPCLTDSSEGPRYDDQMQLVPSCSAVQAAPLLPANKKILDSTMYNFQDPDETKKETLSDDDIGAICEIYPTTKDPGTCAPVGSTSGGCCSTSGRNDRPLGTLALVGATVLTLFRRRKRR
jgi:hypothetical protein